MKRFLVLLLALGVLAVADPTSLFSQDKEKDKEKKDKDDKKDKDKDDKKDKDKDDKKDKEKEVFDKPLSKEQKEELEKLSGTFKVVEFERDGKKASKEEMAKMKVVQKGSEWTFSEGSDSTSGKDVPYPGKSPKEIDSLYLNGAARDKVVKGIYKIDGDTIIYCWAEPDKARPKEFATKAESGLTLMKLQKTKDEDEKKDKDKDEKKDKDKKDKEKKDKDDKKDKDKEDKKDK